MTVLRSIRLASLWSTALVTLSATAHAQDAAPPAGSHTPEATPLDHGFDAPPPSARPRAWWHWLNGNITADGVRRDLAWMHRIGLGGVQNFDASLDTPQIVADRLAYMTPAWRAVFREAVQLADAQGMEFGIAASPGWSETGGPWVLPQDGMKKLVWSEWRVPGGEPISGPLPPLPTATGPFQTLTASGPAFNTGVAASHPPQAGGTIAIIAIPDRAPSLPRPAAFADNGAQVDAAVLGDADLDSGIVFDAQSDGGGHLTLDYGKPVTVRAARIFVKDAQPPFAPPRLVATLEADIGGHWTAIAPVPLAEIPTTVAFDAVTAQRFRVVLARNTASPPADALGSVPGAVVAPLFPAVADKTLAIGDFALFAADRIDRAEAKAGFATVPDYHVLPTRTATGPAPQEVIDLSDRVSPDGSLAWTPPAGTAWRIYRFGWSLTGKTNHPASPEATGLEADKYDDGAVRRHLEHYLDLYRDTVGPELIGQRGIRALVTDSIEVGASNWTPRLLAEFKARRGYDPKPWLPALAGALVGSAAQSDRFLFDFRQTLADLMAEKHYGTIAKVAHERGLVVYGEALEDGRPVLGSDLAMRRATDVPMSALWTFPRDGAPRPGLLGDIKGAASVAHFYGQNVVAAESMTSAFSPWAFAPADLRHVIDREFVWGVNRPVIHTSVHQPDDTHLPGLSLSIFGQYFNRHETWAEMARPWIDYMARTGFLLQQGRNHADIALFLGEETPLATWFSRGVPKNLPTGYAYDVLDAAMLTALSTADNGDLVSPGGARYHALMLSGTTRYMSGAALAQLDRLSQHGARIFGPRPVASPTLSDDPTAFAATVDRIWQRPAVVDTGDASQAMAQWGLAKDFRATGVTQDIPFVHRQLPHGDLYFLVNPGTTPLVFDGHFRVTGKAPEIWDAVTGSKRPASYRQEASETVMPLNLAAEQSLFVLFRHDTTRPARTVSAPIFLRRASIEGPWEVSFQTGLGAPAHLALPHLQGFETITDKRVRYFSGTARYRKEFRLASRLARKHKDIWLDLGKVGDVAQVKINGHFAGTAWFAPYRINVSPWLRSGRNTVEIDVANLWVNRLIGDQQSDAVKTTWTSVPTYRADAPLRPAGLIGPVRLLVRVDKFR